LTLQAAHEQGGATAVQWMLDNDDRCEHWASRLGAQVSFLLTGDEVLLNELQTSRPPGMCHILPEWRVAAGRDLGKSLFLQQGRVGATGRPKASATTSPPDASGARRRRTRRAATGSGGGGSGQPATGAKASAAPKREP